MSFVNKPMEIRNQSTDEQDCYELYIDGGSRAVLTKKNGMVQLNWAVYGPQYWPEAKQLLQGLLELSVIADQLAGESYAKPEED